MRRHTCLSLALLFAASCTQQAPLGGPGGTASGNKATILFYRDSGNTCRTVTTPYVKASKGRGNMTWKVDDDDTGCATADVVKVVFDVSGNPDPLPGCTKEIPAGEKSFSCDLSGITVPIPPRKYSVFLGSTKTEDPEIEFGT